MSFEYTPCMHKEQRIEFLQLKEHEDLKKDYVVHKKQWPMWPGLWKKGLLRSGGGSSGGCREHRTTDYMPVSYATCLSILIYEGDLKG